MAVRGVGFVGMRTERVGGIEKLFGEVIGLPVTRREGQHVGFNMVDRTVPELHGADDEFHDFLTTGPVAGFRVEDFDATLAAMVAAGVGFIGEIQQAGGPRRQHFRCPDGTIGEIVGPAG